MSMQLIYARGLQQSYSCWRHKVRARPDCIIFWFCNYESLAICATGTSLSSSSSWVAGAYINKKPILIYYHNIIWAFNAEYEARWKNNINTPKRDEVQFTHDLIKDTQGQGNETTLSTALLLLCPSYAQTKYLWVCKSLVCPQLNARDELKVIHQRRQSQAKAVLYLNNTKKGFPCIHGYMPYSEIPFSLHSSSCSGLLQLTTRLSLWHVRCIPW